MLLANALSSVGNGQVVQALWISELAAVAHLVPKGWTPETAPADWREQIGQWDRLHMVRLALIVAAFVLVTVAAGR